MIRSRLVLAQGARSSSLRLIASSSCSNSRRKALLPQQAQRRAWAARSFASLSTPSPTRPQKQSQALQPHDRLLVVGSGVAGCAAALVAAETYQLPVTLLFAGQTPSDCNSYWAQGGIIYQGRRQHDSPALLAADIHRAGAGLCHDPAVQKVATEGPARVRQLLLDSSSSSGGDGRFANVPFDVVASTGELALCLEASHSAPRILHKADHTGAVITQHITQAAARHPLIRLQPSTIVTDLVVVDGGVGCVGVETLQPARSSGSHSTNTPLRPVTEYATHGTVLASGGLAGIYEHSTNPAGFNALGSSVAIATRAGVATQDLEFVQFHPTALCLPGKARFLLTEALRGEGAVLRDASGRAFAKDYHEAGELAPRDIVARAVFSESQKSSDGRHNVFLDITHRDAAWLHNRFPTICQHLREHSDLDLARDPLPIIPAAHYTCGGIATDLTGSTSLPGCYAAGEAARTGLHGGNRLASTSLLEGLVFGAAVADDAASSEGRARAVEASRAVASLQKKTAATATTASSSKSSSSPNDNAVARRLLRELRGFMWDYVGVTRTRSGLEEQALPKLEELRDEAAALHRAAPTLETAAVRDATCAGHAVAQAALANNQSVGAHCLVAEGPAAAAVETDSDDEAEVAVAAR